MDYEASQALAQALPVSKELSERLANIIQTDIAEAAGQGVTRIVEPHIPGSQLIGLVTKLIDCGYQIDYDEDEPTDTGIVSYPNYMLTIDWSGLKENEN